jgi:hypothetical protein
MAPKAGQFNFVQTQPISVVTPEAETLFLSLAEVNEYTGVYGGKLVFTPELLATPVKYKVGKGKEQVKPFEDVINNMVDDALAEYTASGKKATKAPKIQPDKDKDGEETGKFVISCKNQEQPRIVNSDRTVEKNFTTLVSNGSTIKAQLYLKAYVMNGKVGITAYLSTVLLVNVIEYGGSNDMFDDDDFNNDAPSFDAPADGDDDF